MANTAPPTGGSEQKPKRSPRALRPHLTVTEKRRRRAEIHLTRLQHQQQTVLTHLVEWARSQAVPPGTFAAALVEFLALMVAKNFEPSEQATQIDKFSTYMKERVATMDASYRGSL